MKTALLSVSDKSGIIEFAKQLAELNYNIVSTGGTFTALKNAGINCIQVSDLTGFEECLDGRVKTLHPYVHAGILYLRDNKDHTEQIEKLKISSIDLVAVNLYPFKETISKPNCDFGDAVENIDIGGPTMLRSSAKNYKFVYSVCDPYDYNEVIEDIKSGNMSESFKLKLMYKTFQHTSFYDTLIASYLKKKCGIEFSNELTVAYEKISDLRYGENPHQSASYYSEALGDNIVTGCTQLHGKELSFNNINDINSTLAILGEFDKPCAVAVKHTNPCGVGTGKNIYEAYLRAYEADKVSIFGGIVAVNGIIEKDTAEELNKIFIEIIIADDYTQEALYILKLKKNIRIMKNPVQKTKPSVINYKHIKGGILAQQTDNLLYNEADFKTVTNKKPTESQIKDLIFAYKIVKHVKSNAIVLAKDGRTVGIGTGQTNRIWATKQAIEHAGEHAENAVLASDAFFPFADCVTVASEAKISAIIQPGGSLRDNDSIVECDKNDIAMIFCGTRHFKH